MIQIYTINFDGSTNKVIDWLYFYGHQVKRINSDIDGFLPINLTITSNKQTKLKLNNEYSKNTWFRKGQILSKKSIQNLNCSNVHITQHLVSEIEGLRSTLLFEINNSKKITLGYNEHNEVGYANKLINLIKAQEVGLDIPNTIVSNRKSDIEEFITENKEVIVKPLQSGLFIHTAKNSYAVYTEVITKDNIALYPDNLFPCCFQENIIKDYEIRVFYLEGQVFASAIFSQSDDKTKVDFRKYNFQKMNRLVPYKLPKEIEKRILKFMKKIKLDTGSLDIIKSMDGRYVFLEVNPVGEYDMVSINCNYYLHEKIAKYLIK